MKTVIFNGSPRNKKSNSAILIDHFLKGYSGVSNKQVPVHFLASRKSRADHIRAFREAETVLIIFPLYTDCMPGILKEFLEEIHTLPVTNQKSIAFIIQSGFPESIHSVYVEKYLEKFAGRNGLHYIGSVIKGGIEGIQIMPPWMTKKIFSKFEDLGVHFARTRTFSPEIKKELAKPYKLSFYRRAMLRLMCKTGMANFYWNSRLKKNNAWEQRFAKPYSELTKP